VERDQRDRPSKVLVVGLDGGTYTVLHPLMDKGEMPTLAAMIEGGSWGELISTIPPHTAPAWASFITGKNPGKHGVFQFVPIDRSLYEGRRTRIVNSGTLSGQALWNIIGQADKKVGVINVPLTYPPNEVNGFMVTGMLTPRESRHFTYPPHLASFLGDYKIDISVGEEEYGVLDDLNTDHPEVLAAFIEELTSLVDMRTETAIRMIEMYTPDFFIMLFTETDRLQHILWPWLQSNRLQFESQAERKLAEAVAHFYRNLDHNLAKLIKIAGEQTIKIFMSDHGFGPSTKKNVNFNVWLQDEGFLRLQKNPRSLLNPRHWLKRMGLNRENLYCLISSVLSGKVVRKLEKTWGRVVSTPIDWSRTKAVFVPIFEFVGGIQIISPDDVQQPEWRTSGDYEDFRNSLMQQLLELRDPQTNGPIVLQAYKREGLYQGAHTCDAPDIIFVMATDYRGDRSLLSKSLVHEKFQNISLWRGTHRREGLVVFNGPHISPGRLSATPQIQDLTPTILYLLGIPIPEDMDGRVIKEIVEASYLARNEIEYSRPTSPLKEDSEAGTMELSEEEAEKVRKQLESLGYIS